MARPPRRLTALTRGSYVRVDNPAGNGVRVNNPDGWLTDPAHWVSMGPQRPERTSPFAWQGRDSGYGTIGPGSWSGMPGGWGGGDVNTVVVPAVERCTSVIVNAVVRTGWQTHRGDTRTATPLWVTDPMLVGTVPGVLESPTPVMHRLGPTDFWSTLLTHAMWYGLGAFIFAEAADGTPLPGSLRLVNPFLLTFDPNRGWLLGDPSDPVVVPHDGRIPVGSTTFRVVPLRGAAPNDGMLGEGVLVRHWEALQIGVELRTYLSKAYFAGNQPTGFLKVNKPDFTAAAAEALKAKWMAAHGGSTRSVAILNATTDYTPLATTNPVDAAAAEMTHVSRSDVALMFGLDPIWVGEGAGGLTYNNASDRRRDLVDLTASTWGQKLMDVLTGLLPYGTRLSIDWRSFVIPLTGPGVDPVTVPPATGEAPS